MQLKTLRVNSGMTQETLAKELGVTQQAYQRYESGSRKLPVDVAKRIGEMFEIAWPELYEDED